MLVSDWQSLIKKFLNILMVAQTFRDQKGQWIDDELEWVTYERQVMFDTTNKERADRSLPPVTIDDIKRVEGWASGHIDYSRKFALYCAELSIGKSKPPI